MAVAPSFHKLARSADGVATFEPTETRPAKVLFCVNALAEPNSGTLELEVMFVPPPQLMADPMLTTPVPLGVSVRLPDVLVILAGVDAPTATEVNAPVLGVPLPMAGGEA